MSSKLIQPDQNQLEASIIETTSAVDKDHTFTLYLIEVSMLVAEERVSWTVQRRYREFRELRSNLADQFPDLEAVPFPAKSIKSNASIVEARKIELQSWLRALLFNTDTKVRKCQELLAFLNANPPPVSKTTKIKPRSQDTSRSSHHDEDMVEP